MRTIAEVKGLTKSFGDVTVVHDVSFTLEANKIYGLLGRNGAGKTTIMHMMTAQLFPTSGELLVFGEAPYENNRVLSKICFIKESQKYPDSFRVIDVIGLCPSIFPNWDQELASKLLYDFNLPLRRRIKKLSRGMLSSVGIIIGLASRAPLTIFDEPYLGLDAAARNLFYDRLIEDYAEHPRTIVLSTHLIDEVSQLLEHVIVIDGGKILLNEESDALRGRAYSVVGQRELVESFIAGHTIIDRQPLGGLLSATVLDNLTPHIQEQAASLGLDLSTVSLQQLIVHLTKRKSDRKAVESR
ncbi:ABC transporter ATP-binding protein [Paenibacillus alvei]|uniref:ABC transporter ATP-binding protein n=1 Tax=Paenibacillus TaxID=44249 RepID=UPI000287D645|nr:ABC transporter ATP-binding protein [Paenibacillus alvei]EJW16065.1 putative ABC transporter ATP-binding protein YhcG [Paenibacillus alvei DSM 29]MCY7482887.1 ABC transporter ATP-binding protein [Paenibacillus alvei]MCY9541233.1 ABC transporter ATP-binding protein [Paenibacillus alvei]MCY9704586.1 ABC transporter ATP-binding protein [Paenibacillus alvei]MCY9732754.1 ABC transporter ATP-binding protein [Paenibacillus alvei]